MDCGRSFDVMSEILTDEPTKDELTGCTCLQLRKLTRLVTQIYDERLSSVGLTCTQFSVLAYLKLKPDFTVGQLAGALVMDPTTVTRVLRPLERDGFLELRESRSDRRQRIIVLTKRGRATFSRALPIWRQAVSEVARLLGRDETARLGTSLQSSMTRLLQH
jgi:DNA-binding MarR family transcriptional regulator